jgi:hypothetical protein
MSNLGFSIENNYAASKALRRSRNLASAAGLDFSQETARRSLQQPETRAPYRLFFAVAIALLLSAAYAFPERATTVLHGLGVI